MGKSNKKRGGFDREKKREKSSPKREKVGLIFGFKGKKTDF